MKLKIKGGICMLVCYFLLFTVNAATISGKVTDSKTNQPIAGATISLLQLRSSTSSDQQGVIHSNHCPRVDVILSKYVLLGTNR
ncbi:carboxypeptidase-like regulatory domain-containing protein [Sphingobacterium sp. E70]|uniref:carboxypeptidase-like regulatory domain-containing protein n=1 Tax=Sphingobacterium sp. E70 TaxID=2853439 RepID=UPI00211CB020|nr:carboxypeptidase-like regulatory domain-containing protein [Sphingobacterium sp. E70]ULT23078.1 carboxypeptidase-like regulatory domain-containing protein [Sphingobacterium sp. E70]